MLQSEPSYPVVQVQVPSVQVPPLLQTTDLHLSVLQLLKYTTDETVKKAAMAKVKNLILFMIDNDFVF